MGFSRLSYRARQLDAHLRAGAPRPAPSWLEPEEAELFGAMTPADQREGLNVASTLAEWGWAADRSLILAGLLHDVGKSRAPSQGAAYRVVVTVVETVWPALFSQLARINRTFRVLRDHAAIGADVARQAGLPADTVGLIAAHHGPAADGRLAALQRADALH